MYDATNLDGLPVGGNLYAGYVGGKYNTYHILLIRYANTLCVSIAINDAEDAMVLDVEKGDATPEEAPAWAERQRARGQIPTVYCNRSTLPSVEAEFKALNVAPPCYWIAAPGYAGLYPGSVATQNVFAGTYDQSTVADFWPGIDAPAPASVVKAAVLPPPVAPPAPAPIAPKDYFMDFISKDPTPGSLGYWLIDHDLGFRKPILDTPTLTMLISTGMYEEKDFDAAEFADIPPR